MYIDGPAGRLQALYHAAEMEGMPAVVICHPHPQFGGSMHNKVAYWMGRTFAGEGCSVLKFNFRGVGQSEGEWDEGRGEVDDAQAALDWLRRQQPCSPLWLAGFSFGCYAGLKAASCDERVSRIFAVAPAVNKWSFDFMHANKRPLTVISGTEDEIVPFVCLRQWVDSLSCVHFHAIEGASHFFPKHMQQMCQALIEEVIIMK